jgi:hypothetical protein
VSVNVRMVAACKRCSQIQLCEAPRRVCHVTPRVQFMGKMSEYKGFQDQSDEYVKAARLPNGCVVAPEMDPQRDKKQAPHCKTINAM